MSREYLSVPFEIKAAADDAGVFEGYGSVFGNVDLGGDVVAHGAFAKSLETWQAKNKLPKMLLQHGGGGFLSGPAPDDLVPIGKWEAMSEDSHGLHVKGRLFRLETDRSKSVYAAMKEGELDGLSIGYFPRETVKGKTKEDPERTIKRADLLEVSVVTFPMNTAARVEGVKSALEYTEREIEGILRDAGFSRKEAQTFIAKGFRALRDSAPEVDGLISEVEKQAYLRRWAA
jgi:HK97 family phage prohead protease